MAHCVWSGDEEIALIKNNGVFVAHCPQSNTNLASGIAPVRRYLEAGLSLGLGSDVAGGVHTSIFRAMQDAVAVSKLCKYLASSGNQPSTHTSAHIHIIEEKPLTVEEAFSMATRGGGAFFGKAGSFEAGFECDALVIDDTDFAPPGTLSIQERLERAVYLSDDRHISAKWARGVKIL
jgi:guanine deaminase